MQIKLIVAQRVEGMTQSGIRINAHLMTAPPENGAVPIPVKMEIGGLSPEQARNFPVGRALEITIPSYTKVEGSRIVNLEQA
jgi:hypothetical protein